MISYLVIDSIGKAYARCELELLDIKESSQVELMDRETMMVDIPIEMVFQNTSDIHEGDILVVQHSSEVIEAVYGKDEEEKARRMAEIKKIMAE